MPLTTLILSRDVVLVVSAFYFRYKSLPPPVSDASTPWTHSILSKRVNDVGGGGTPIYFEWGCATGFTKVLPFTKPNFADFDPTVYPTKNAQLFLISVFCEQSR